MKKKKKDNFEVGPNEVWVETEKTIQPSPYFLKWWQDLSLKRFGDNTHWLKIAFELGYVSKKIDTKSGEVTFDPIEFEYDIQLVRRTLGISVDMPIIRYTETGEDEYKRVIDLLFHNDGDNNGK
jgi:hypothetical protein